MATYEAVKFDVGFFLTGEVPDPDLVLLVDSGTLEGMPLELGIESSPLHKYKVTGTVTENSIPVSRTLRLYREATGEMMSETVSSVTGAYTLTTPYNEDHYVVCMDAAGGEDYNHLIKKNVDIVVI